MNFDSKACLGRITADMRDSYSRNRRVMSFTEYLALFENDMLRHARSAAQYLRDVFDHYGTISIQGPRGALTRWRLFDCPWDGGRDSLKGQEEVQATVDGQAWRQQSFPYQAKCLKWLRESHAALDGEARAQVDGLLAGTGCEALFDAGA